MNKGMQGGAMPPNPLKLFCEGVCEVRVLLDGAYKTIYSGYFTDFDAAYQSAIRWDGKGNIYFVMNPVVPDAMARRLAGKMDKAGNGDTTSDADITGRRWFLMDFDPQRAAGISATEAEKALAQGAMENAREVLLAHGFKEPVVCDSGNGFHLLFRIDMPNDPAHAQLLKDALSCADMLFSTDAVKVDLKVFNAARITKLYGSMAVKGQSTAERPHRRSAVLCVPEQIEVTPTAIFHDFVKAYKQEPPMRNSRHYRGFEFDLDRWISDHGIRIKDTINTADGTRYILQDGCPFNPEHKGKDAVLFRHHSGSIGFKCFHNSCAGNGWKEFRLLYEPDAYDRKQSGFRPTAKDNFSEVSPPVEAGTAVKAVDEVLKGKPDTLDALIPDELLDTLFDMEDEIARQREIAKLKAVAKEKKFTREFDALIKAKKEQTDKKRRTELTASRPEEEYIVLKDIPLQGLSVPPGWHIGVGRGVWRVGENGLESACPHPIIITDRLQNVDTGTEKLNLAFYRDWRWKQIPVKRSTSGSRTAIIALADNGIQVTSESSRFLVQYLHDLETENAQEIPRRRSIARVGWIGEKEFFPYTENCVFDGEDEMRDMFEGVTGAGSYRDWIDTIGGARTESMAFRALLAASFSAPMLWMFEALCYCLHIWGGTGTGKTVALYAAMSVWGDPARLYRSFNATEIGLEKSAGFCHSIPLAIDERETSGSDRQTAFDKIIYRLTEGRGRTKADRNGNLRQTGHWRIPILTNGEAPLLADNSKGGAMGRAIELYCAQPIFDNAPELAGFVKANYGHAGREWIRRLIEKRSVKAGLQEMRDTFEGFQGFLREKGDFNDKPIASAALILTADFYASCWIFRMEEGAAMIRAQELGEYIIGDLLTKEDADTTGRAWDYLCGWVATNIGHFRSFADPCYGIIGTGYVYLLGSCFNDALTEKNFNPIAEAKEFARRGLIQRPDNGKRLQFQQRINGVRTTGYRLNLDVQDSSACTQ